MKDISKKKEENVKSMPTPVKRIYRELEVKTTDKSPPLAMKLKLIQEKTFKEPHGVRYHLIHENCFISKLVNHFFLNLVHIFSMKFF